MFEFFKQLVYLHTTESVNFSICLKHAFKKIDEIANLAKMPFHGKFLWTDLESGKELSLDSDNFFIGKISVFIIISIFFFLNGLINLSK